MGPEDDPTARLQAFQSVHYSILPDVMLKKSNHPTCVQCDKEILHIRHHTLFTPRDFDGSLYFLIIKPTIRQIVNPHRLKWDDSTEAEES